MWLIPGMPQGNDKMSLEYLVVLERRCRGVGGDETMSREWSLPEVPNGQSWNSLRKKHGIRLPKYKIPMCLYCYLNKWFNKKSSDKCLLQKNFKLFM